MNGGQARALADRLRAASSAAIVTVAALFAMACEGRPRPPDASSTDTHEAKRRGPAVAVFDLSGGVPEQDKPGLFGVSSGKRSFDELLRLGADLRDDADTIGQAPSSSGWSIPSHINLVAPLRPAWPNCRQNLVRDWACTKSTMRFQAASCASL